MSGKNEKVDKEYIAIGLIVVLVIITGMRLLILSKTIGNMGRDYATPETSVSSISFPGDAGDRIRISFASRIESGDLDITIYDSKGNVVKELDRARKLKDFVTLEYADTYTLEAECTEFIGNYKISLFQVD